MPSDALIKSDFTRTQYTARDRSPTQSWNLLGPTLVDTFRLLARAARAALGTNIIVGPFDDATLARVGVWVEGHPADLEPFFERLEKEK